MSLPNLGGLRLAEPAAETGEWYLFKKEPLNELLADGKITEHDVEDQSQDPISLDPLLEEGEEGEGETERWVWKATPADGGQGRRENLPEEEGVRDAPNAAERGLNYDPVNYFRWLLEKNGTDPTTRYDVPPEAIRNLARGPPNPRADGVDDDDRDRRAMAEPSVVEALIEAQRVQRANLVRREAEEAEAARAAAARAVEAAATEETLAGRMDALVEEFDPGLLREALHAAIVRRETAQQAAQEAAAAASDEARQREYRLMSAAVLAMGVARDEYPRVLDVAVQLGRNDWLPDYARDFMRNVHLDAERDSRDLGARETMERSVKWTYPLKAKDLIGEDALAIYWLRKSSSVSRNCFFASLYVREDSMLGSLIRSLEDRSARGLLSRTVSASLEHALLRQITEPLMMEPVSRTNPTQAAELYDLIRNWGDGAVGFGRMFNAEISPFTPEPATQTEVRIPPGGRTHWKVWVIKITCHVKLMRWMVKEAGGPFLFYYTQTGARALQNSVGWLADGVQRLRGQMQSDTLASSWDPAATLSANAGAMRLDNWKLACQQMRLMMSAAVGWVHTQPILGGLLHAGQPDPHPFLSWDALQHRGFYTPWCNITVPPEHTTHTIESPDGEAVFEWNATDVDKLWYGLSGKLVMGVRVAANGDRAPADPM